jgi:hypothetical protein
MKKIWSLGTLRVLIRSIILLVIMTRMEVIMNTVQNHHWIGVLLLLCAVVYIVWGMFWHESPES